MKTAALITFCCEAGAIMGKASSSARQALAAYGQELGLAFQIASDIESFGAGNLSWRGSHRWRRFWGVTGLPHRPKHW